MKSDLPPKKLNFDDLTVRLREYIRLRINSGEYTERSLARILRISQPHLHNVLKGVRRVSVGFADKVMIKFQMTALDLLSSDEIWSYLDEKDPNWMVLAGRRKPPAKDDLRMAWRTPRSGT